QVVLAAAAGEDDDGGGRGAEQRDEGSEVSAHARSGRATVHRGPFTPPRLGISVAAPGRYARDPGEYAPFAVPGAARAAPAYAASPYACGAGGSPYCASPLPWNPPAPGTLQQ